MTAPRSRTHRYAVRLSTPGDDGLLREERGRSCLPLDEARELLAEWREDRVGGGVYELLGPGNEVLEGWRWSGTRWAPHPAPSGGRGSETRARPAQLLLRCTTLERAELDAAGLVGAAALACLLERARGRG